jgi:hypothetical protein
MQLLTALIVCVSGVGLLTAGFIVSPTGEIHSSVLVAFGECLTFAGALLGIDYHYRQGGGR